MFPRNSLLSKFHSNEIKGLSQFMPFSVGKQISLKKFYVKPMTHDIGIIRVQDQTRQQNRNIFNWRKPTFQRQ